MMQLLLCAIFSLSCFTPAARADLDAAAGHPYPANQCYGGCTPPEERIWTAFESAGPPTASARGRVFSGECYHRSAEYDGLHAHHGVVMFEGSDDWFMAGRFSFFYDKNPYATWTPTDVLRELNPQREAKSRLHFENGFGWVDFNPLATPIWQYYFRSRGDVLYVIGFWGVKHTLFCEFPPNAPRTEVLGADRSSSQ